MKQVVSTQYYMHGVPFLSKVRCLFRYDACHDCYICTRIFKNSIKNSKGFRNVRISIETSGDISVL